MSRYDDIMDLQRPVSTKHPPMTRLDRAAQFAPFQGLSGFGATIIEEARLTSGRPELDENEKERLDRRIALLKEHLGSMPPVTLTVFTDDEKKSGGEISEKSFRVKKIDEAERTIVADDGTKVSLDDILGIDSDIFSRSPGI